VQHQCRIFLDTMYVYTETETNYWQHCAKRNAPVLNLLRGRF